MNPADFDRIVDTMRHIVREELYREEFRRLSEYTDRLSKCEGANLKDMDCNVFALKVTVPFSDIYLAQFPLQVAEKLAQDVAHKFRSAIVAKIRGSQ